MGNIWDNIWGDRTPETIKKFHDDVNALIEEQREIEISIEARDNFSKKFKKWSKDIKNAVGSSVIKGLEGKTGAVGKGLKTVTAGAGTTAATTATTAPTSLPPKYQNFVDEVKFGQLSILGTSKRIERIAATYGPNGRGLKVADEKSKVIEINNKQLVQQTATAEGVKTLVANTAEKNKEPLGSLSIDLTTDTGKVAGEIFAEPVFLTKLKSFVTTQTNDATRQAVS